MDKIQMHDDYLAQLHDTYKKKNADYGDSFGKTYVDLGIISAITRISDKFNRLVSLATKPDSQMVMDESIVDTLLDMANYCVMTVMEMEIQNIKNNIEKEGK